MRLVFFILLGCNETQTVEPKTPEVNGPVALRNTLPVNENPPAKSKSPVPKLRIKDSDLFKPYRANKAAPDQFSAVLSTSKGDVLIYSERIWAPNGVDRLYALLKLDYFEQSAFFKSPAINTLNFGMHALPKITRKWEKTTFKDDPVRQPNSMGTLSFARTSLPHTRSVRLFVNLSDNRQLDAQGYAPVARVASEDMGILKKIDAFINSGKIEVPTRKELQKDGIKPWLADGDPLRIEKSYLCNAKKIPEAIQNKCASTPLKR